MQHEDIHKDLKEKAIFLAEKHLVLLITLSALLSRLATGVI